MPSRSASSQAAARISARVCSRRRLRTSIVSLADTLYPIDVWISEQCSLSHGDAALSSPRAVATAETALRRCLAAVGGEKLESLPLWELLGEAALARDRPDAALEIARHLANLGASQRCAIAAARAERLEGRAHEPSEAGRAHLEKALAAFTRLGIPLEAAGTRLLLAEALREVASEVAVDEARVALDAFEALGAAHDADRAAGLLRHLGLSASRAGPKGLQPLTNREQEVLGLLGEGLSNVDMADRLYISPRTVEQHVARVLAKLGLKSRTEAAAEAVRQGTTGARR